MSNRRSGMCSGYDLAYQFVEDGAAPDRRYQGGYAIIGGYPNNSMQNINAMYGYRPSDRMLSLHSSTGRPELRTPIPSRHDYWGYSYGFGMDFSNKVFAARRHKADVLTSNALTRQSSLPNNLSLVDIIGSYDAGANYSTYMGSEASENAIYQGTKQKPTTIGNEVHEQPCDVDALTLSATLTTEDSQKVSEEPAYVSQVVLDVEKGEPVKEESVPAQAVVRVGRTRSCYRRSVGASNRNQIISCVEFPQGEELIDNLTLGDIGDQARQEYATSRHRRGAPKSAAQKSLSSSREEKKTEAPMSLHPLKLQSGISNTCSPENAEKTLSQIEQSNTASEVSNEHSIANLDPSQHFNDPARAPRKLTAPGTESTAATCRTLEESPNRVHTVVVLENIPKGNHTITSNDSQVTYHGQTIKVSEVRKRRQNSFEYNSPAIQQLCKVASQGYNVALLSSEAPNTSSRFMSPVWQMLVQLVRKVLADHSDDKGRLEPDFELSCALGYILSDKCKDILTEPGATFQKITIQTSPIYGANLLELQYYRITDAATFEEHLTTCLSRANASPIMSSFMEGFVGAFLNMKQGIQMENGEKDICLSSIIVTSAGCDLKPYTDALNRDYNIYGSIFHLAVLGPCFLCYMLNISDDDTIKQSAVPPGSTVSGEVEKLLSILKQMSCTENLPLRSGSVRRFLSYVKQNYEKTKERLASEDLKEDKRKRLEKFLIETQTLMDVYAKILCTSEKNPKLTDSNIF